MGLLSMFGGGCHLIVLLKMSHFNVNTSLSL